MTIQHYPQEIKLQECEDSIYISNLYHLFFLHIHLVSFISHLFNAPVCVNSWEFNRKQANEPKCMEYGWIWIQHKRSWFHTQVQTVMYIKEKGSLTTRNKHDFGKACFFSSSSHGVIGNQLDSETLGKGSACEWHCKKRTKNTFSSRNLTKMLAHLTIKSRKRKALKFPN